MTFESIGLDLTIPVTWTPLSWGGAILSGLIIGYLGMLVCVRRGLFDPTEFQRPRTVAVVIFVLSMWSSAIFWGTQILAVMLAGDPLWPRTISRAIIEIAGHSAGVGIGTWLYLRSRR